MIKRVDTAIYDAIEAVADGTFKGGGAGVRPGRGRHRLLDQRTRRADDARTSSTRSRSTSRRSSTATSRSPTDPPRSERAGPIDADMTTDDGAGRASAPPLVVMEHITKRFPGVRRQRRRHPSSSVPGEVHALDRRERRGQVHADARAVRDVPARRRPHLGPGPGGEDRVAARRDRARHRHGPPALRAGGPVHRHREHHPGRRGWPRSSTRESAERQGAGARRRPTGSTSTPPPSSRTCPSARSSGSRS